MARPITMNEYKAIMELLDNGFEYDEEGISKTFRPNVKVKLALTLEANLGLRISDIIRLTPNSIKNNKLSIIEKKTNKLQCVKWALLVDLLNKEEITYGKQ